MEDWKERLKAEYAQTKERYEKLKAYNNKQEVEAYLLKDIAEEPEDMYSRVLLKKQQRSLYKRPGVRKIIRKKQSFSFLPKEKMAQSV